MEPHEKICTDGSTLSGSPYPWLVSYDNTGQIFTNIQTHEHYHCQIPELLNRTILGYFHGWLILSNHPNHFTLWNPTTFNFIHLPNFKQKVQKKVCGDVLYACLSLPPEDPNSIVLLFTRTKYRILFCVLADKRRKWVVMSYAKQLAADDYYRLNNNPVCCNPVCCNGKVYATIFRRIVLLDIVVKHQDVKKKREVVINLVKVVDLPFIPLCYFYLTAGSHNDLFTVLEVVREYDFTRFLSLHLYKLNFDNLVWEEIKSFKGHVVFLDFKNRSLTSGPAAEPNSGSYIHLIRNDKLYSYNVEDKTASLYSIPCPNLARGLLPLGHTSVWITPKIRLKDATEECSKEEEIVVLAPVSTVEGDLIMNDKQLQMEVKQVQGIVHNIPFLVLDLVADYLLALEYLNFRATCTSFRSAAPSKQWSTATALARLQTYSLISPLLMVIDVYQGMITCIDPRLGDKYFMTRLPESIGHSRVMYSKYGWLLIYDLVKGHLLFNPFTAAVIQLPLLPYSPLATSFGFSAPPNSPDCKVFFFYDHVYMTSPGESVWHTIDNESYIPRFLRHDTLAFCDQHVYIFSGDENIGIMEIDGDNRWEIAQAPKLKSDGVVRYLVECDNQLLSVIVDEFGGELEIFKLNHSTREWGKVDSLGKHMIFIYETQAFSAIAKISEMENKIYFPRYREGKIVFYSLDTRKYNTFAGKKEEAFDDFLPTQEQLLSVWIEPNWSV